MNGWAIMKEGRFKSMQPRYTQMARLHTNGNKAVTRPSNLEHFIQEYICFFCFLLLRLLIKIPSKLKDFSSNHTCNYLIKVHLHYMQIYVRDGSYVLSITVPQCLEQCMWQSRYLTMLFCLMPDYIFVFIMFYYRILSIYKYRE